MSINGADYLFEKSKEINEKKKRKGFFKHFKLPVILLVLLFFGYAFYLSDLSKIRYIEISGNHFISDQKILEMIQIKENNHYFDPKVFKIKRTLLNHFIIDDVSISFSKRILSIDIKERIPLGYWQNEDTVNLLFKDGYIEPLSSDDYQMLVGSILFDQSLDPENKEELLNLLLQTDSSILDNIIKISSYSFSFDQSIYLISMNDGNFVFLDKNNVNQFNYYYQILKAKKNSLHCIYMLNKDSNPYSSSCPWENDKPEGTDDPVAD